MLSKFIIAHRGIHDNEVIPENSLLAFKETLKKNIPIEFDVQLTLDNELIVFHDENLERLTGIDKILQTVNFDELKKLFLLNTKEKIPTLREVLKLVSGKVLIDIEIKKTKKIEETIELLLNELENYQGEVIIKSFYPKILKTIKKKTNKYKVGLLLTNKSKNKFINIISSTKLFLKIIKPDFIAIDKRMLNKKYLKKIKNDYPIYLWTIRNERELKKYRKLYPDFVYICNIK